MMDLRERLTRRFKERICTVCVHRTADGGCALQGEHECPVFRWADQLAELAGTIESDKLTDYIDKIQEVICPQCAQDEEGHCVDREHLDCPVDLYTSLVIDILEDELGRDT